MIPPTPTDTTSTSPRRDSRAENPSQSHENRAETDAMSEDATHATAARATIQWLRSFCLRHRWTTLIAVTALVVSIPNWRIGLMAMSDWPIAKTIAQVAIIAATAMFAVAPLPASVAVIAAYSIDVWLPYPYLESNGWCLAIALGYLAFRLRPWCSALAFVYLCLMKYWELAGTGMQVPPSTMIGTMISLCSSYLAALIIGILARRQQELESLRRRMLRVQHMERNMEAAHRLHDATSGELTSISLTARLGLHETGTDERSELFRRILAQSNEALAHVHEIIRLLAEEPDGPDSPGAAGDVAVGSGGNAGDDTVEGTAIIGGGTVRRSTAAGDDTAPSRAGFRTRVDGWEHALHDAGFACDITVEGDVDDNTNGIDDASRDLLVALAREIVANVIRHADPADRRCMLRITVSESGVDVTSSNPIPPTPQRSARATRDDAGRVTPSHGLALLRHRIAARSGSLTASAEHGMWHLHAVIPTAPQRG